ncbi:hypothetical protein ACP70R_042156 [Stipagrostis hirtigluma subsp. patula]
MSELQGWADLPEVLLHSVLPLLASFRDLLAFAATCPSWRAAYCAYPSKSAFTTLCPPLLLRPHPKNLQPLPFNRNLFESRDPTNLLSLNGRRRGSQVPADSPYDLMVKFRKSLKAQIPHSFNDIATGISIPRRFPRLGKATLSSTSSSSFFFIGASFGHLILSSDNSCVIVDAFTGAKLSSPPLPGSRHSELNLYGALTAPPASHNSHLVVSSTDPCSTFFWSVNTSKPWSEPTGSRRKIALRHIVAFKGEVFGMDSYHRLFRVQLTPEVSVHKIQLVTREGTLSKQRLAVSWLVPCGDALLLIGVGSHGAIDAYRLEMSTELAKLVKVDRLDNCAIFISNDERSQPLSCMNPEKWGGRSNVVYTPAPEKRQPRWLVSKLGQQLPINVEVRCEDFLQPAWAVPSIFSSCHDG